MKVLALLVVGLALPMPLHAQPQRASIEDQARIITFIEQARRAVDDYRDQFGHSTTNYGKALDKKIELEIKMGISHNDDGTPLREPTEDDLKMISGGWFGHDSRVDYNQAVRTCQEAAETERENYAKAMDIAMRAYNISPEQKDMGSPVVNGPPWDLKKGTLYWSPRFSKKPDVFDSGEPKTASEDRPAFIRDSDGSIIIRDAAFVDFYKHPDPGQFASILYHEKLHVDEYSDPSKDL